MRWRVLPWERLTLGFGSLAGGVAFYPVALWTWLRVRPSYAAYVVAATFFYTFTGFWISTPRYLLVVFPLFLLLGRIRNEAVLAVVVVGSLTGLVALAAAFTAPMWAF
jgi:hypothetical protein